MSTITIAQIIVIILTGILVVTAWLIFMIFETKKKLKDLKTDNKEDIKRLGMKFLKLAEHFGLGTAEYADDFWEHEWGSPYFMAGETQLPNNDKKVTRQIDFDTLLKYLKLEIADIEQHKEIQKIKPVKKSNSN